MLQKTLVMEVPEVAKKMLHRPAPLYRWSRRLRAGAAGGIASAVLMAMFAAVVTAMGGHDALELGTLIASTFFDPTTTNPVGTVIVAVGAHVVVGAVLGTAFAAATQTIPSAWRLFALGALYGVAIFALMAYVALPPLNPELSLAMQSGWFLAYHVVFGLGLAATLFVPRWVQRPREIDPRLG